MTVPEKHKFPPNLGFVAPKGPKVCTKVGNNWQVRVINALKEALLNALPSFIYQFPISTRCYFTSLLNLVAPTWQLKLNRFFNSSGTA